MTEDDLPEFETEKILSRVTDAEDIERMTTDTDERPCGEIHPLPCGLDEDCPVPADYFDVELDSDEIVETWRVNKG